jgi:hypothetical protein
MSSQQLSFSSYSSLSPLHLLCVTNQALLFITATLFSLSTHYTATYTEPNNDMLQQNAPVHGPKPEVTISMLRQVDHVAHQVTKAEMGDTDYGVWH